MNYSGTIVKKFDKNDKTEWDDFIDKSRNGTFIHKIDYLHYHLDRFTDCSLIIKKHNQIVAVMPGNIEDSTFYSHKGLTYGGLIILPETKVEDVILYFNLINIYLKEKEQIKNVYYKAIPYIYSNIPSQEDEYVLFRLNAKLVNCGISSTLRTGHKIPFSSSRKQGINKALKKGLSIKTEYNYNDFWHVLTTNLQKSHNTKPVHSLSEITRLKISFPDNIKLFSVYLENECLAGVIIYISKNVAHVQYISASEKGKEVSALDYLFDYLINQIFTNVEYFDFGTSVENSGFYLNEGLIFQKQGFGARGVLYQHYAYEINNIIQNKKEV